MISFRLLFVIILLLPLGCSHTPENRDVLFQISTIDALLGGAYDGKLTYGELREYGDFGIGTFNGLDGEMIETGGKFYQVRSDGVAYPVADSMKTPFAVVTFFDPDESISLNEEMNYDQFKRYLDDLLPTQNIFYAIEMKGTFRYVKARSVPKQNRPYPPLVEVTKSQPIFEFHDITGTMVGFRCPDYVKGINASGYHLHFLTEDGKAGGHLLELQTRDVDIDIDYTSQFHMMLPEGDFAGMDLTKDRQMELEKVE